MRSLPLPGSDRRRRTRQETRQERVNAVLTAMDERIAVAEEATGQLITLEERRLARIRRYLNELDPRRDNDQ